MHAGLDVNTPALSQQYTVRDWAVHGEAHDIEAILPGREEPIEIDLGKL